MTDDPNSGSSRDNPAPTREDAALVRDDDPALRSASHSQNNGAAKCLASGPDLSEDQALALLSRRDLPPESIELLSKNSDLIKHRKILLALISHPRTPRHLSVPLIRRLYIFELMKLALSPTLLGDIKIVAEETIISRLETASSGERLSLARRASGRVAAVLLCDPEPRVIRAALDNPFLTEALVVKALMSKHAPKAFVELTCGHAKWSLRQQIQLALLRNENTPLESALQFARDLPANIVRELLHDSQLPESIKACLQAQLDQRL